MGEHYSHGLNLWVSIRISSCTPYSAEKTFKEEVEKLQDAYQKLMTDKDATIEEVKASGLGKLKSVAAFKKSQAAGKGKEEL